MKVGRVGYLINHKIVSKLRGLFGDKTGATSVVFAVSLPAIIGAIILMTEVGYWRLKKADLQATVDMAAIAGAYQFMQEENSPESKMAAYADALDNTFDPAIGVLTTNIPPVGGSFDGEDAVQVTIAQEIPTFFSRFFFDDPLITEVTAVVKLGSESVKACVLALASSGTGISIGGSVDITTENCSLHANSTGDPAFEVFGAAELTAACASSSGVTDIGGSKPKVFSDCPDPLSNKPPVVDPYADVDVPENIDAYPCDYVSTSGHGKHATMTFPDPNGGTVKMCDNKIDLKNTINLEPGTYVFNSTELKFGNGGFVTGDDVTLIFRNNAELSNINGGNGFDISAPNSGDYAGIAMYADRNTMSNTEWKLNGNADMSVYGAIYLPTLDIDYVGGADTNATECTQLVAYRISFNGNSGFKNNCDPAGTSDIFGPGASRIALVE